MLVVKAGTTLSTSLSPSPASCTGMRIRLPPCSSLFPSLFLSNIFINMTVIMPPVTKHARLCQNSLPKSIFCSFTRWCPASAREENTQCFGAWWSICSCLPILAVTSIIVKGSSSQKNIFCVCWKRSKMEQRKQRWFYFWVGNISVYFWKKMDQSQCTFEARKWALWTGKRFRAGVAFRQVCKTIKIVGKVFVYERLLTNFVEKMLHKHSDWVPKKYWFTKLCR